jgi:hypothetical protein
MKEIESRMSFMKQTKIMNISNRPKNIPTISTQSTGKGEVAVATPTESPTVARAEANSNMAASILYP